MKKLGIFVLLLLNTSPAFSIGQSISSADELIGCYKRIIYPADVMKQMNQFDFYHPEAQKYQWYCFFEDNVFRALTTNKDRKYTTKEIKEFFKNLPAVMSWKFVKDSIVWVEHKEDKKMSSHWLVRRIEKDMYVFGKNLIPKGSLFMAIPTKDLESFVLTRVLKKIDK